MDELQEDQALVQKLQEKCGIIIALFGRIEKTIGYAAKAAGNAGRNN